MNDNNSGTRDYFYPFSPQKIKINGHALSYLDEGEGPVIVMLHGNPTWSYYYRNLVVLLREKYRVIVPDHMGCGLSDKPAKYSYRLENHINNVLTLLDKLQISSYSLVVHDWGGAIGMGVAGRTPTKPESIVVMNSAAFHSRRIPWRIRVCRARIFGDILIRGFNAFAGAAVHMAVSRKMDPETARGYLAPYDSWANRIATLRFVQDIPLSAQDPSWETLGRIEDSLPLFRDIPLLLLWGGRDFCFTRAFYDEWLERFPQAESRFFPQAGHYVLEDAFEEIKPLVAAFFNRYLDEGPSRAEEK